MRGIALSLLFISAAACSSSELFSHYGSSTEDRSWHWRSVTVCRHVSAILDFAMVELSCGVAFSDSDQAYAQYDINHQIALCNFDGHGADSVQLLLTPNAAALLDRMNRPDEQLRQQQAIYRALQMIGGHIGLPTLLLFSIFSKTTQRDLTFINFCFTWIFSSITFSLGLYRLGPASRFFGVTLPFIHSDQECLNQAALVSGAQAMTDTAMCALIVQLWFDFRAAIHGPPSPRQIRWTRATVNLIHHHVSLVQSGLMVSQMSFYCMLFNNNTFLISQYTVLLAILIVTLIFDACIIHILYRRWRFFQRTGGKALGVAHSVAFRVVIFCVYRIVVAVAYVATMLNTQGITVLSGNRPDGVPTQGITVLRQPSGSEPIITREISVLAGPNASSLIPVWVDMLQAGTPLVAFLIFGTSKEFLDALMFWRWFNPILTTSMCCRRRSPVTPRESNAGGEVVDYESVVSGDSVLDIRQETKGTDGSLAL
ncbi:hypothetical protein JB92DRAFT_3026747 [Gautieria morchelliformis]|nr:hypothetical protein JB92DRAFT_3026747 [Gautieria morchelliformis]